FVLVGPPGDPAGVRGAESAADAFGRIADRRARFVSRGDDSGTHQKERELWAESGREPRGEWYVSVGAGMAQALRVAHERGAYTLADRGTFLALRAGLELAVCHEGDPLLKNRYAVILVNPQRHPHVRADAARRFADFLTRPETRQVIGRFGVDRFGEPLFFPEGNALAPSGP
ncbi:MAG TPA: substrate-binding domain-containing protein, partial [Gemmataceae bacterium]